MCSVIGAIIKEPRAEDFLMLRRVFFESMIRGKHATGISFLPHWSDAIQTISKPVSADVFITQHLKDSDFDNMLDKDGNLYLIGHCRYSTSTLEYNQPIHNSKKSIVHNGVITQELPENWKGLYGYDCLTQNDSELILHSNDPLGEFSHMSMAVCELTANRQLRVYRNGKRPLYLTSLLNGSIITSTVDIPRRANVLGSTKMIPMNQYTVIGSDFTESASVVSKEKDFQEVNYGI